MTDQPHHAAARTMTAGEAKATGRCGDQHWNDMVCELDAGHDGNHQSTSRHHVWTATTPEQARAVLARLRERNDADLAKFRDRNGRLL